MSAFHHEPRHRFSDREMAEIFAEHDGRCANCGVTIRSGMEWDLDHRIPLSLGGTNDRSNMQPLCENCHSTKTSGDISQAAKSKRIAVKHTVPSRHRKSRGWR